MVLTQIKQRKRPAKVFIDSSVLVAGAISYKGTARELLIKGFQNQFDLYISPEVLEESERNISRKAPDSLNDFYIFKKALERKLAKINKNLILKVSEMVEIKDAPIVAGALQAKAVYG